MNGLISLLTRWLLSRLAFNPVTAVLRVLSAHKNQHEKLQARTAELQAVLDGIPDVYVRFDAEDRVVSFNDHGSNLFAGRQDVLGKYSWEVLRPEAVALRTPIVAELKRTGEPQVLIHQIAVEGRMEWVEARYFALEDGHYFAMVRSISELKRIEDELRESEARLASITDNIPGGVFRRVLHPDGTTSYPYLSEGFREIFDLDPVKAMENSAYIREATVPEHRENHLRATRVSAETLESYDEVTALRGEDGRVRWSHVIGKPRRMENGDVVWDGVTVDVTHQIQAENKLRESEGRLALVFEHMPVMMSAFDEKGIIVAWNRECEAVTGYSAAEVINNPDAIRMINPDPTYLKQMVAEWKERGTDYRDWEWSIRCKDGTERTIAWSDVSEKFKVPGWASWGIGIDVTERKRAEEKLGESRQLLQTVLDTVPHWIWVIDKDQRYLLINKAFCDDFGISREDTIGLHNSELIHESIIDRVTKQNEEVMRTGEMPVAMESEFPLPDGTPTFRRIVKIPLMDEHGAVTGLVGVSEDITERKRDQERLSQSEHDLSEAQRIGHVGSWRSDLETDELVWSDESFRIYGFEPQQGPAARELFWDLMHPDDLEKTRKVVRKALEDDTNYEMEHRILRRDGTERVLVQRGEVVRDAGGAPIALQGVMLDITERKRAEEELSESRQLLQMVLDTVPHWIWVKGTDTKFKMVNRSMAEGVGYSSEEIIGKGNSDFLPEEATHRFMEEERKIIETGEGIADPERVIKINGRETSYHNIIKLPLRDARGEITGIVGISEVITDRKKAEQALRISQRHLAEAQRIAHVGSWTSDLTTKELTWSDETYRIFGFEPQSCDVDQNLFHELVHPRDREPVSQALTKTKKDGKPFRFEHRIVRHDGTERYVYEIGEMVHDDQGRPASLQGVVLDITERKKVDIIKNEFVSVVSHELRTPLTSIIGSLGLIEAGVAGEISDQALQMIGIAHTNGKRLGRLINDILDLEKIESGNLELLFRRIGIRHLIYAAIDANQGFANQFGVNLIASAHLPRTDLWGDEDSLMQVLANIISNAVKFSPEGGHVEIDAMELDSRIRISIHDQGPGIALEARKRIFDRFVQEDSSDTRTIDGTGLGLSISRAIVREHGGEIGVESDIGRGSTFYFDIPLAMDDRDTADPSPHKQGAV